MKNLRTRESQSAATFQLKEQTIKGFLKIVGVSARFGWCYNGIRADPGRVEKRINTKQPQQHLLTSSHAHNKETGAIIMIALSFGPFGSFSRAIHTAKWPCGVDFSPERKRNDFARPLIEWRWVSPPPPPLLFQQLPPHCRRRGNVKRRFPVERRTTTASECE